MNNKAVFIGSLYPSSMMSELLRRQEHIDFAANTFQSCLVEGLSKLYDEFAIITSPVTSSFPKSKTILYKREMFLCLNNKVRMIRTAFINIPIIKMISEYLEIKQLIRMYSDKGTTVYVYALHSPFLVALLSNRSYYNTGCLIVPDLPEYMSNNRGVIRRVLKSINNKIICKSIHAFDSFVLLSPYMIEKYPLFGKKWLQIEGIFSPLNTNVKESEYLDTRKKSILYSGAISDKYGVFDLIKAFSLIQGYEYELLLCGGCQEEMGTFDKLISKDQRIKYLGLLDKSKVRLLQSSVSLLVNPRHSNEEYTFYSFPSKTMEYLASGTPTLMCHLPAIPKEYDDFIFYFEDESIEGMSRRMIDILNMEYGSLKERGEKARAFILQNKSADVQSRKLYSFVES